MISDWSKVAQMHWGGGTPSYLDPDEIRDIGGYIRERLNLSHDIEASVEIDPRNLTREHMAAFREIGFNRTSFGVQDFDLAGSGGDKSRSVRRDHAADGRVGPRARISRASISI